jgi:hypothetical protein
MTEAFISRTNKAKSVAVMKKYMRSKRGILEETSESSKSSLEEVPTPSLEVKGSAGSSVAPISAN